MDEKELLEIEARANAATYSPSEDIKRARHDIPRLIAAVREARRAGMLEAAEMVERDDFPPGANAKDVADAIRRAAEDGA